LTLLARVARKEPERAVDLHHGELRPVCRDQDVLGHPRASPFGEPPPGLKELAEHRIAFLSCAVRLSADPRPARVGLR